MPEDTKIHGGSSPLYKMVYYLHITYTHLPIYFILFLFIYFWLCWVFIAARGLSLVVVSGGYSSSRCAGFSLRWLLLQHVGSSQTRARTRVPCIGRWILNHCTTKEALPIHFKSSLNYL